LNCCRLRDWLSKQAEREEEKRRKQQERLERRLAVPRHNFDDPEYHRQKVEVAENLDDALTAGISFDFNML